jgi:hypothetical protein
VGPILTGNPGRRQPDHKRIIARESQVDHDHLNERHELLIMGIHEFKGAGTFSIGWAFKLRRHALIGREDQSYQLERPHFALMNAPIGGSNLDRGANYLGRKG